MTSKDILFLAKALAVVLGIFLFIFWVFYASQPLIPWDEAILLAAQRIFWLGLGCSLGVRVIVWYADRQRKKINR